VKLARGMAKPSVSQEDLVGRLARLGIQITQTAVSKLENRQRYVMDYEAAAIAKALKVSIAWLFEDA
jgi:transcriptional regulator with XRE-family HTH domain